MYHFDDLFPNENYRPLGLFLFFHGFIDSLIILFLEVDNVGVSLR